MWWRTLASVAIVSAVPLLVAALLPRRERKLQLAIRWLVAFAAGALLGAAFFHLVPESLDWPGHRRLASVLILAGFLVFFILERFLWFHSHAHVTPEHGVPPLATLNLVGDAAHNFVDGMAIAAAYSVHPSLGVATTIAVLFHEVPQEIGDFGVLLHAGLSRARAIAFNLGSALIAFLGALLVLIVGARISWLADGLIPFAAGGFVYIAASDLIPELKREQGPAKSVIMLAAIAFGAALMLLPAFLGIAGEG